MKLIDIKKSIVSESIDANDPVLSSLRAAMDARKLSIEKQKARAKKRVYGKKREQLENQLEDIYQEISSLYKERSDIFDEQDSEAGSLGDKWSDDKANEYGDKLNNIDSSIEKLIQKRIKIEKILSY